MGDLMPIKTFVKYFELHKDSYGYPALVERGGYGALPPKAINGGKIIRIELELDTDIMLSSTIVVKVDMKESSKKIIKAASNIVVPVKHALIDEFEA
jgi:hypothetical protein